MKPTLCDFAKRLLMANQLGVRIEHEDGHRWLIFEATDCAGYFENKSLSSLYHTRFGEYPTSKVYGSAEDALDLLDEHLARLGEHCLLVQFNSQYGGDWEQAWGFYDNTTRKAMGLPVTAAPEPSAI